MNGCDIRLVDKPAGWTSFDVVAKIRGRVRQAYRDKGLTPTKRQLRVGHAGTLDPFATGLLIVLLGDGTKRADEFLKLDKTYEATMRLGAVSSTGDPEGEIKSTSVKIPDRDEIIRVLMSMTGEIVQTPPAYSAIKINGQRAYKLARDGKNVDMPTRTVTIYSLELLDYAYPEVRIRTRVSSGTYIRTLVEDIGTEIGTGAYTTALRRVSVGELWIDGAKDVDTVCREAGVSVE